MDNRAASSWRSFVRVIRAFAEGSVVAVGFAFAILAVGTPIVLIIRGLHEGLSWLARLVGDPSAPVEALVSISSIAGGVTLAAVFIRLLVRFFRHSGRSADCAEHRAAGHFEKLMHQAASAYLAPSDGSTHDSRDRPAVEIRDLARSARM